MPCLMSGIMRPEIVAKLIYSLRSEDKALVEVTLSAIAELGPKAAAASFGTSPAGARVERRDNLEERARVWPNGWSRRAKQQPRLTMKVTGTTKKTVNCDSPFDLGYCCGSLGVSPLPMALAFAIGFPHGR